MVASDKTCKICFQTFSTNANLKLHTNRKTPCVAPEKKTPVVQFKFKCERCDATFQSNKKLESHLNRKFPCKIKGPTPKEIELQISFEKLRTEHLQQQLEQQEEINQLKKQINTTTNNNNTINNKNSNNTTNNVTINVYGQEDMSHITDAMYNYCFRQFDKSVECLFEYKHFSPKMRKNHNVYISNLRDGNMMVRHAKQWDMVGKNITFHRMYADLKNNLFDAWDRMQDDNTTDASTRPIYPKFIIDEIDDERDAMFEKQSCDKMACMAYNNRDYPMKMKKQMDKKRKDGEK